MSEPTTTGKELGVVAYPGVGFSLPQYAGKIDPWEVVIREANPGEPTGPPYDFSRPIPAKYLGGHPLREAVGDIYHAAILAHYGIPFDQWGTPSVQVGYFNELFWTNQASLTYWALDQGLPNPKPKMVEQYDVAWSQPRGGDWYFNYLVKREPGGTAENPRHINDSTFPHGLLPPRSNAILGRYTEYVFNDYDGVPVPVDPPPPTPTPPEVVPDAVAKAILVLDSFKIGTVMGPGRLANVDTVANFFRGVKKVIR